MKKIGIILISLVLSIAIRANDNSEPRISLLTCSAGDDLYSQFWHSALRVSYSSTGHDIVFNFGEFDFGTPNFYYKFIRGKLQYSLGIGYTSEFIRAYESYGREVYEQELTLTQMQKQKIMDRLEYLYKPENRYYFYSFLYKNCTTELRDLLLDIVEIDTRGEVLEKKVGISNRELLNRYTTGWVRFGINLILGSSLDKEIDFCQNMFFPETLMDGLATLTISGEPFTTDGKRISKPIHAPKKAGFLSILISPTVVFALLLVAGVLLLRKGGKLWSVYSKSMLLLCGLAGVVIAVCTLITEHTELYWNLNILLFNPLWIIVALIPTKSVKITNLFRVIMSIAILAMVLVWTLGIQGPEWGFVFIATIMFSITWRERFKKLIE